MNEHDGHEAIMRAFKTDAVVEDDGMVFVEGLPVRAGQRVQIIVLLPDEVIPTDRYPLRGRKPFEYHDPNDPVGEDDWEGDR
jgi:hypothetical protein